MSSTLLEHRITVKAVSGVFYHNGVINFRRWYEIGTLVVVYNKNFQNPTNMGTNNNQTFVQIPYGRLIQKLEYLSQMNDIKLVLPEESYTSKASFSDGDEMPIYG